MYKPLPESLTIKQSGINGLGLFAKEGIAQGTNLGDDSLGKLNGDIIRTPLGGFINHANDAERIVKVELKADQYKKWNLMTVYGISKLKKN